MKFFVRCLRLLFLVKDGLFDPFENNHRYGFRVLHRKYYRLLNLFPFMALSEHGWTPIPYALPSDVKNPAPIQFVFNTDRKRIWVESHTNKKIIVTGNPLLLYKDKQRLKQSDVASGTVVFAAHAFHGVEVGCEWLNLITELQSLPQAFKPITVCLHPHDYKNGLGSQFINSGFSVVSTCEDEVPDFAERLYNILREHKYSCSNVVGTHTFLCVDFGIPFFLIGQNPIYKNNGGTDDVKKISSLLDYEKGLTAYHLFNTGPVTEISPEQMAFVCRENGRGQRAAWLRVCLLLNYYGLRQLFSESAARLKKKAFRSLNFAFRPAREV